MKNINPIIKPIPAFNDNYIWTIVHLERAQAIVVDPGDADPVLSTLEAQNLSLEGILLTHHHWDHTGGVKSLLKHKTIPVYGPKTIEWVTHPVKEGEVIHLSAIDWRFEVLEIPGHTLDHIAYIGRGVLFCGDMLFTGGCGRVFEGTFSQMYESLQKLAALPPETQIYCGHEYTQANLQFAETVEPSNPDIQQRIAQVNASRASRKPTVPAPLSLELKTNPFLRCKEKALQTATSAHSGKKLINPIDVFTEVRLWKDTF